jgi:hypothetical protein
VVPTANKRVGSKHSRPGSITPSPQAAAPVLVLALASVVVGVVPSAVLASVVLPAVVLSSDVVVLVGAPVAAAVVVPVSAVSVAVPAGSGVQASRTASRSGRRSTVGGYANPRATGAVAPARAPGPRRRSASRRLARVCAGPGVAGRFFSPPGRPQPIDTGPMRDWVWNRRGEVVTATIGLILAGCNGSSGDTEASAGTQGSTGAGASSSSSGASTGATSTPTGSGEEEGSNTAGMTTSTSPTTGTSDPTTSTSDPTSGTTGAGTTTGTTSGVMPETTSSTGDGTSSTGAESSTGEGSSSTTGGPPPKCEPGDGMGMGMVDKSYIWIASENSNDVSKVDTQTAANSSFTADPGGSPDRLQHFS